MQLERLLTWARPLMWNGTERQKFQPLSAAIAQEQRNHWERKKEAMEKEKDKRVEMEGK